MTKNKKAAIELSIGTVVIIVLAMTMLILGIVLVRNIFTGAIDIAGVANNQVRSEIIGMFSEEGSSLVVQLGSDKTARIEAGGDAGNVNIGARPKTGGVLTQREDLKFKVGVGSTSLRGDCKNQGVNVNDWFQFNFGEEIGFDKLDDATLFATIRVQVPDGTVSCTQKFFVDVLDKRPNQNNQVVGADSFTVEVIQGGIFS